MTNSVAPAGIDIDMVVPWIRKHHCDGDVGFEVLSVGRSNLTFAVTVDGEKRWVLRRPPLGHRGGSAHNVAREGRIMAALDGTPVPVTRVLDIVDDPEVMEVPFVFMEYCTGFPVNSPEEWARIPDAAKAETALRMMDTLAAIHRVDIEGVGLGELRRPGSLLERQLRRWLGQFEASTSRELPVIQEVHALLQSRMPAESVVGLTHGDYKPNNMIFAPDGTINAVVDWELSAVGEVLTDLGYFMAVMTKVDDSASMWLPRESDGIPSRDVMVARYEQSAGFSVPDLDYFEAFALWKLACIGEGVYSRAINGEMGDVEFDYEEIGAGVEQRAVSALDVLQGRA